MRRSRCVSCDSGGTTLDSPCCADQSAAPGSPAEGPIDLEAEMVSLADEQLRFEATAKLLQKAYQGLRTAIRER